MGVAARAAALAVLREVADGRPFDAALDRALDGLDAADRRLAHEIAAGVLRHRTALDRRLRPLVTAEWRRVAPAVRDLLRVGAYQIVHLTRIPPYAAVQATVETAKRSGATRAAAMVNAVLRRLAAEPGPGGTGEEHDLAARHSHPEWLVARWVRRFGRERTEALLRYDNARPRLVIQAVAWTRDALQAALDAEGIGWEPVPHGAGLAVRARSVRRLPGYDAGAFVVQDPAQARLLAHAAVPAGSRVWDACASPGGKAAVLNTTCRVIASDLRAARTRRLRETVTRAAKDVTLMRADAASPPLREGSMDAVLLDAPCSATGTMARHPDARWRLTEASIARSAARQGRLLDGVAPVVRPGGLLVYLTCSLEPEENSDQVDAFLARHAEFARDGTDLFLFPPDVGSDGGFGARLRRVA